jgi:DNA-binding response OmpR family regulator
MYNILLIEDDLDMQELISDYLENYDFKVSAYSKPKEALKELSSHKGRYAVIILDLMLPQIDGFDVCRIIRKESYIPIIISSARGELSDKILCFDFGADDYLAKPYEPRELVLRINSILRRTTSQNKTIGDFEINTDKMFIKVDGYELDLTQIEYDLLNIFLQNRVKVMSRELLSNAVNGIEYNTKDRR